MIGVYVSRPNICIIYDFSITKLIIYNWVSFKVINGHISGTI